MTTHEKLRPPLVLDTSLFSNPETQQFFGDSVDSALLRFLEIARENDLQLFMPVSIYRELSNFATPDVLKAFRRDAVVRGPDRYSIQVPATLLSSFIRDLRNRVNQGLRIAEKAIQSENVPDNIRRVRERYRSALRSGIVDSEEDFDVVLMAKEVGGAILSADEGIANMAEELGLEVLSAADFIDRYANQEGEA